MREDLWISGPRDVKLRGHVWKNTTASRELLLIHGYSEHSLCYRPMVDFFLHHGFNITAFDLPGHGESSGRRSSIDDFDDYLSSVDVVQNYFLPGWAGRPIYCFAHSLGALIAIRYVQSRSNLVWKKLACSSPLLGLGGYPSMLLPLIRGALEILPDWSWEQPRLRGEYLTHDGARTQERLQDPLIRPSLSLRWVREILKARSRAFDDIAKLRIPLALFQAGDERITDKKEARRFFRNLQSLKNPTSLRWTEYEGWYHELSNEIDRSRFYSDLLSWYDAP